MLKEFSFFFYLVGVQDFQEGLVDIWLALEAILNLVDVIYGVVKLHRLVVLESWPARRRAADRSVGLNRRRARGSIRWDGWVRLAGGCVGWRLNKLRRETTVQKYVTLLHPVSSYC